MKTNSASVKNLVVSGVGWVNYYGEKVNFRFEGEAGGNFNLGEIRSNLSCGDSSDYDNLENCTMTYRNENRVYFSDHTQIGSAWVNVNVYGYLNSNGRVVVSIGKKGTRINLENIKNFTKATTEKYFGKDLTPSIKEKKNVYDKNHSYYYGEAKLVNMKFNESALKDFKKTKDQMNTNYAKNNISITVSQPYLQIYINEQPKEVIDARSNDEKMMIWPYRRAAITITKDKVYTDTVVDKMDPDLAVKKLNEKVSPYTFVDNWEVKGHVTRAYPIRVMAADVRGGMGIAEDVVVSAPSTAPAIMGENSNITFTTTDKMGASAQIQDKNSNSMMDSFENDYPEFKDIQKPEESSLTNLIKKLAKIISEIFPSQ